MYGDQANKLIAEAKRAQGLAQLPVFQDELVRDIVRETKELERLRQQVEEENASQEASGSFQAQLFVTHLTMRRNKRCLLAYERLRAQRLAEMVWENNEVEVPNHNEQEYFKNYESIVLDYKTEFPELDLGAPLVPPKDVFIDVRVLKDAGEIQTEYGVFNLRKDSQFFVRRADVERLIQQGYLQRV